MRHPLFVLVAVACAVAGYAVVHARPDTAAGATPAVSMAGPSVDASPTTPPSFVGRAVKLYFRGSDDLPVPEMPSSNPGEVRLARTVTYISGTVKQVRGGWIELTLSAPTGQNDMWVQSQLVAFIVADEVQPPTTRP